jgi:hypothetical protein
VNQIRDKIHLYKMTSYADDRQIKKYVQIIVGSLFWFYWNYNCAESDKIASLITELAIGVKEMMSSAQSNINQYSGAAKRAATCYTRLLFDVCFCTFGIQDPRHGQRLSNAMKLTNNLMRGITLDTFKPNGISPDALTNSVKNIADFLKIVKEGLKNIVYSIRGNPLSAKDEEEIYKAARILLEDSIKWIEGRGGTRGFAGPLVDAVRPLVGLVLQLQQSTASGDLLQLYEASQGISALSSDCFASFLPEATSTSDADAKELILLNLKTMLCFSNIIAIAAAAQITNNKAVHRGHIAFCARNIANCAAMLVDSLALLRV